jgi:thiol peroxidase
MLTNVKFQGNPLTLVGRNIKENSPAPNFRLVNTDLAEVSLLNFNGKIKVITSFPSLDTPVCDLQLKEFNSRASALSADIVIIGVSKDLPFAQKRFCEANNIRNVITLSDYRYSSFGINYGLLIKELNLLARAALILDKNNTLRYLQIVEELTTQLNYEGVLQHLEEVLKSPTLSIKEELPAKCKPCEIGTPPLSKGPIDKFIAEHPGWAFKDNERLVKEIKFKDSLEAKYFFDIVSIISEEQAHHPILTLIYNKLKISLTTHASGGVTENDLIIANIIDGLK